MYDNGREFRCGVHGKGLGMHVGFDMKMMRIALSCIHISLLVYENLLVAHVCVFFSFCYFINK